MEKQTLGATISLLRKRKGLTQAALAYKLGVTDKAVSKWERNLSYPDISLFPKLADVLGVTADDLLREYTDVERPSRLSEVFGISHDIRTPLHIIIGCANMAVSCPDDRERLLHYLECIRISGEYLLCVLDNAMELASMEEHRFPCDLFELNQYLKEAPNAGASDLIKNIREYDFTGKRILIAEDMSVNQEIIKELLSGTGAEIDFAEDGRICLKKLKENEEEYYDLILMDISMPNMDGIEATRRIRNLSDEKKRRIPIIAMTANVYARDRKAALDAGMDDFAGKPIDTGKLLSIMDKYLSGRKNEA